MIVNFNATIIISVSSFPFQFTITLCRIFNNYKIINRIKLIVTEKTEFRWGVWKNEDHKKVHT